MGEHQRVPRLESLKNLVLVNVALDGIGKQDHSNVGGLGRVGDAFHCKPFSLRLLPALRALVEADDNVATGVFQVQRVGVALAAVADDGDLLPV